MPRPDAPMTTPAHVVSEGELPSKAAHSQSMRVERAARRRALLRRLVAVSSVLLGFGALRVVREVSRAEHALARDEAAGGRIATVVLEPGHHVRLPVEPNTDVVRLVVAAFGESRTDVSPFAARLSLEAHGARGSREESIEVTMPGTSRRAVAEEASVRVFDPAAVNLDLGELGTGELVVTLDSVAGARGVLVRSYRRESVPVLDAIRRRTNLGEAKRERLARRAGSIDWVDLDTTDKATLLGARWRRLAPLPDSEQATNWKTITLLAPTNDERHERPPAVATEPVEPGETVRYLRVTREHPLVVSSSGPPLVLRLGARRAMSPDAPTPARIALTATFTKPGISSVRSVLNADVVASPDRYETPKDTRTPSEHAVFHLLVPSLGTVSVTSSEDPVDIVLSELDEEASPRPLLPRTADGEEQPSASSRPAPWNGFVARRPTNASAFAADEYSGTIRLTPRPAAARNERNAVSSVIARPLRRRGTSGMLRGRLLFVPMETGASVELRADGPELLPMRLYTKQGTDVVVRVDGGHPERRSDVAVRAVTTTRSLRVDGETRATLVLGDDLSRGKHVLSFEGKAGAQVWVHLPWAQRPGRKQASEWISGDFDQ